MKNLARLKAIKKTHEKQGVQADDYWGFAYDDIDWLIEQAERAQELEKKNARLRERNRELREFKNLVLEV